MAAAPPGSGAAVIRETGARGHSVHALLRHIEPVGFEGASMSVGDPYVVELSITATRRNQEACPKIRTRKPLGGIVDLCHYFLLRSHAAPKTISTSKVPSLFAVLVILVGPSISYCFISRSTSAAGTRRM